MIFATPSTFRRRMLFIGIATPILVALVLAVDVLVGIFTNPAFLTSGPLFKAIQRTHGTAGKIESLHSSITEKTPATSPPLSPRPLHGRSEGRLPLHTLAAHCLRRLR